MPCLIPRCVACYVGGCFADLARSLLDCIVINRHLKSVCVLEHKITLKCNVNSLDFNFPSIIKEIIFRPYLNHFGFSMALISFFIRIEIRKSILMNNNRNCKTTTFPLSIPSQLISLQYYFQMRKDIIYLTSLITILCVTKLHSRGSAHRGPSHQMCRHE